jgi:proteasome alpha subunit
MAMQFYASPEQIMRDRSEYARKGIARGRSVVVLSCQDGVLLVAENVSSALHKVAEIYDRIAFAAVGRYNEFENLRMAGVRLADTRGYLYNRRDVTGRGLANAYAQTLGAIFSDQLKPMEVEICVAEVGDRPERDQLYRITYEGSVGDEPGFVAMGGQADSISSTVREGHSTDLDLRAALKLAVSALRRTGGDGGQDRTVPSDQLEVALLDRRRPKRAFRRITGARLEELLADEAPADGANGDSASGPAPADPGTTSAPEGQTDAAAPPEAPEDGDGPGDGDGSTGS